MKTLLASFAVFCVTSFGGLAQAQIIYQDDFGRTGDLNGSNPSPTDTPNASWVVHTGGNVDSGPVATWETTGTFAQLTLSASAGAQSQADAFLPEAITSGFVYTLSANLTATQGSWIAFGFTVSDNSDWDHVSPYSWMLLRPASDPSSNGTQYFQGPFVTGGSQNTGTGGQGDLYTIVLDTTGSLWTTKTYDNGNLVSSYIYSTNPSGAGLPQYVGFGTNGSDLGNTDTVSNFTFSAVAAPEPSTYVTLGFGFAFLIALRRVRRSKSI